MSRTIHLPEDKRLLSQLETLRDAWLAKPARSFQRDAHLSSDAIACDCSGLINLLMDEMGVPKPYRLSRPKAVHYYAILQELGSRQISQVSRGYLMAWRKDRLPKSGDTGHVLIAWGSPKQVAPYDYQLEVIDATKAQGGLAQRCIDLRVNELGQIIGVRLHQADSKLKLCSIYHGKFLDSRYCFACAMPHKVCLCGQIESELKNTPSITVLRHPDERKRTLSTVSLIKQRYPNVLVKDGERFSPIRERNLVCLYPDGQPLQQIEATQGVVVPNVEGEGVLSDISADPHYLLIDATWKKSKRMMHENPWLADLPRMGLNPSERSHYLIRKVPRPDALSSLESFALACHDATLIELFKYFMGKQLDIMGPEVYERNYGHYLNFNHKGDV